jgi:thiol:disulfide interchange protein
MQMGAAIGLAALGAISTAHAQTLMAQGQSVSAALTGGYQLAFLLAAACVVAALAVVLIVIRPSGGDTHRQPRVELDRAEAEAA